MWSVEETQLARLPCFWHRRQKVYMLVRSSSLAASMSRYLIRRIEESPKIVVRPHAEIVGLEGGDHLESVRWQNNRTGQIEEHKIRHIFIMTGADPNTSWLEGCVILDSKGFIKTGPDLSPENLSTRRLASFPPAIFARNQFTGSFRGG